MRGWLDFPFPWDWDWFVEETEEVKRKRKELREAQERAIEEQRKKYEEKPAIVPAFMPQILRLDEEAFRGALDRYAKEHPDEKVSGTAINKENFVYRAVQIRREESYEK